MASMGGFPGQDGGHELGVYVPDAQRRKLAEDARYVAGVAEAVSGVGYEVSKTYVEGPTVFDYPDHVIQVDLGGPVADLIWDGLKGWRIIVYSSPTSTHDDELSRGLTDSTAVPAHTVLRMARILMDQAVDRWVRTFTFFGHWQDDHIVVDYHVPGTVEDTRDDDRWEQGLWSATASASTVERAQAAVLAPYASDQVAAR